MIASQHNSRNFEKSKTANNFKWEVFHEPIPTAAELAAKQKLPAELYSLLKDTTDYGWYTTSVELGPEDLPKKNDVS
ncbi:beta-galactosidase 13-like, partial [Trifolium medium]|nr:beta-galactosidase 13-like [Trifolium medium]